MRFQIRDDQYGLALVEADTARDALYGFFASRVRGELRPLIEETPDGGATVDYDGCAYRAVASTS